MSHEFTKYVLKGITDITMGLWLITGLAFGFIMIIYLAYVSAGVYEGQTPFWLYHFVASAVIPLLYFGIPYTAEKRREFYKRLNKKVKKK